MNDLPIIDIFSLVEVYFGSEKVVNTLIKLMKDSLQIMVK